jgi:hypothetical protein
VTPRIVKIGKCICGLSYQPTAPPRRKKGNFLFPDLLGRIALATPRAFRALNNDQFLLRQLDSKFKQGVIDYRTVYLAGYTATYYPDDDRVVLGISYPAELGIYQEAEGRLFRDKFGLMLKSIYIPDFTEKEFLNLYKLIVRLGGLKKVKSFTVVNKRWPGSLSNNPNGTVNFAFERSELQG